MRANVNAWVEWSVVASKMCTFSHILFEKQNSNSIVRVLCVNICLSYTNRRMCVENTHWRWSVQAATANTSWKRQHNNNHFICILHLSFCALDYSFQSLSFLTIQFCVHTRQAYRVNDFCAKCLLLSWAQFEATTPPQPTKKKKFNSI